MKKILLIDIMNASIISSEQVNKIQEWLGDEWIIIFAELNSDKVMEVVELENPAK